MVKSIALFAPSRLRSALFLGVLTLAPGSDSYADSGESGAPEAYEDEIHRETAELERVRSELEQARSQAKSISARENQILEQLNSIDSDLGLKERQIQGLRRKEERLSLDLQEARVRLNRERTRLEERREILRRRLRNIYKYGEQLGLQVLLGASSAVDVVRRFDWLLLVAAQDRMLYEDIQRSISNVQESELDLASTMDEVQNVRQASEREKSELVRKKGDRADLLNSVRTEKQRHTRVVMELEDAEKEVKSLIAQLEKEAKDALFGDELLGGTPFAQALGKLPWPVSGKVVRWFGLQKDRRFGTSTFNGGLDIQADREAEVVAVHRGRADYVSWLPGYGQCIIINHGDGYYTLYAHTSTIFVSAGDLVQAGDIIATVGDTGSLLGNILHFEIRKNAEPINPAPWLKSTKLR